MKRYLEGHMKRYLLLTVLIGCQGAESSTPPMTNAGIVTTAEGSTIPVSDVEQLYAAVNDETNAGATVVLAPGHYVLSAKDATGADRPNGGRLELQTDMSLVGTENGRTEDCNRGLVTIDAFLLPRESFDFPSFGRIGIIRTGRGSNAIECLTIAGNPIAVAAVATDLVQTDPTGKPLPTALWVAHVSAGDSARGVDIKNVTAAMAGRRIVADIEDSEFFRGVEGIRVINFMAADRGEISVTMQGNHSYENVVGCEIENNRSSFASIAVQSYGDRFEDNGAGCEIGGALISTKTGAANSNTTRFDAHGSEFTNNTRTEFYNNTGPKFYFLGDGLQVVGAEVLPSGAANTASDNTVVVRLWDVKIADNRNDDDFLAFGAHSLLDPPALAGTNNHALVQLRGSSALLDVVAVDSEPPDPNGTNTVTVVRIP